MDRAPVFGTGCWGFESLLDRHFCLYLNADDARSRSALQSMFLHKPSVPATGNTIMAMRAGNIVLAALSSGEGAHCFCDPDSAF